MTSMLNTLRYARALKNAGVDAQQAEAMADALEAEVTEQIASKADIERLEERLGNQITTLATETKADIQRLDTKIDHLDEKLTGRIDGLDKRIDGLDKRIDGLDNRIDGLKTTIGVSVALATLVLTAIQVYFGVR